ncbi:hypothetical protein [Streptomyces sp. NPDC086838]|uniref:hypothetical protein n=1 Tax=Streptomyces sp. NPDC086838 TaxID=3365762 RepID=UPI00382458CD
MNINDVVQERVDAARRKIADDKRRRTELAEARQHGIARRHAQKLQRLRAKAQQERADQSGPDTRAREER